MIGLVWHAGLDEVSAGEVEALAAAATAVDGTAPLGEHVLLHLRRDDAAHLLARDETGALRGVAQLDAGEGGATAELVVHPDARRAGLGRRLVEALAERVGSAPLNVWAHGQHPGAVALAARLGFTAARELWQMRRDLAEPVPDPELPAGVVLRPFVVGADEDEFLRVNNAAFDWHPEQGGWDLDRIRDGEAQPWFDPAGFLLAVDARGRVLGFHWTKVHTDPEPIGEVYVLGVDPAARGLRLGAALTLAGLQHLRDARGQTRVLLYVEADNSPAVRLYGSLGFTRWQADVSYRR
ncbi:mycothiol synthase [Pseudonocardia kunmingensis]|uniref:mycothiol synthase n=1 Tax=Pseudonocardia kunmingensis TaxID=630975 RepID=UPI0011503C76|nr:mycothiol synthase [Pseudonocardia kunmingensis]